MSTQNKSSFLRTLVISVTAFGCAVGLLLPTSAIVTHGHGAERGGNNSGSRHTATLRVSDSPEGSRVVLTANQSLNNYEAYRRGDRFFVKIPLSKVPRVDSVRGRAFTEVKVEQIDDATIVSFRLQPGARARVEQWPDRLEIVFVVSRTRTTTTVASNRPAAHASSRVAPTKTAVRHSINSRPVVAKVGNTSRQRAAVATAARPVARRSATSPRFSIPEEQDAAAVEQEPAAEPDLADEPSPETVVESPALPETNWATAAVRTRANPNSAWTNLKERTRYSLQVARGNPVPSGIGLVLVLFFFGVVILQRRRAKTSRADALLFAAVEPDATESETETVAASQTVVRDAADETRVLPTEDRTPGEAISGGVIGKLVLDNAHRAEIMGSRSPEDRKAIESSLMRVMMTTDASDHDRLRARQALEEYGFVAQHSATLLKGRDAWERACAARALGLIGSKTSMPFLIEALNDDDGIVRNQAVASLAGLKDPAAIGALLEASRKHPDVPAALLSETLSACTVDSLSFLDLPSSEAALLSETAVRTDEDTQWLEELRDDVNDEILSGWLEPLDDHREDVGIEDVARPLVVRAVQERPYLRVVA